MMKERAKERRERNEPCTTSIEVPSSMPLFLAERGNRRTNANVKVPLRRKGRDFLSKRQVRCNLEIFFALSPFLPSEREVYRRPFDCRACNVRK